ncbi:EAL domain-containing protein [Duganella sp. FT50W]|uniref:EAL domain-containing protein n=1 Tax=Duganella lactea TaxID=2692173 RepID=A0A6L8MJK2_9BURK|nr:EAL domain-containing protein [Duganella lactea]
MSVVAKGVETEKHLQILKKLGCDENQGYYVVQLCSQMRWPKKMRRRLVLPGQQASNTEDK